MYNIAIDMHNAAILINARKEHTTFLLIIVYVSLWLWMVSIDDEALYERGYLHHEEAGMGPPKSKFGHEKVLAGSKRGSDSFDRLPTMQQGNLLSSNGRRQDE